MHTKIKRYRTIHCMLSESRFFYQSFFANIFPICRLWCHSFDSIIKWINVALQSDSLRPQTITSAFSESPTSAPRSLCVSSILFCFHLYLPPTSKSTDLLSTHFFKTFLPGILIAMYIFNTEIRIKIALKSDARRRSL